MWRKLPETQKTRQHYILTGTTTWFVSQDYYYDRFLDTPSFRLGPGITHKRITCLDTWKVLPSQGHPVEQ